MVERTAQLTQVFERHNLAELATCLAANWVTGEIPASRRLGEELAGEGVVVVGADKIEPECLDEAGSDLFRRGGGSGQWAPGT